ncbi:MAG: tetratricopeptide repeat protein [Chloroflexi bacterium]|nr:tetratricopeptide repeat protein [Chloroflexota bacterium]
MWREFFALALAAPFLILATPRWWVGLAIIAAAWIVRRQATGQWTERTPLDLPFLLILASTPLALWASVDRGFAMALAMRVFFGIAVVYGIVNAVESEKGVWWGLVGLSLLGVLVTVVAALGMESPWQKMFDLSFVYGFLPHSLPRLSDGNETYYLRAGYHPNTIGGMLAMLIPVGAGLMLALPGWVRRPARYRLFLGVGVLLMAGTLLVTQSRTAWIAAAAALGLLTFRTDRRWLLLLPLVALAAGTILFLRQTSSQFSFLVTGGRGAVWAQAWALIRLYPFTGTGLDPYPLVAEFHFPYYLIFKNPVILNLAPADRLWVHAHNFWLQTWLDFGLIGLLGAVGVFIAWGRMAVRLVLSPPGNVPRAWVLGLLSSFVAFAIFGLTDGPFFYRKMTLVLWPVLGLTVCLYKLAGSREPSPPRRSKLSVRERRLAGGAIALLTLLLLPMAGSLLAANLGNVLYHRAALGQGTDAQLPVPVTGSSVWLGRAVRLSPDNAAAWRDLGRTYAATGDVTAAQESFQRALSLRPGDRFTWYHLGQARQAWGDEAGAIAAWQKADAWLLFMDRGDQEAAAGNRSAAATDYQTAAQIRPEDRLAAARLRDVLRK